METIGKRWSGADWATEQREIMLVGVGGIGSWLALSLSRVGHELYLIDPDVVDVTNVEGGQMYFRKHVGKSKVTSVIELCREFGCSNPIGPIVEEYSSEMGMMDVCITALDNMAARKLVFETWVKETDGGNSHAPQEKNCLFIDGRLLLENMEILCIQRNREDQIKKYREEYLFSDEEVVELDCTTKQSTFGAMIIAGIITATLCNWLTNRKLGMEFRETPFYQRFYLPIFENKQINLEQNAEKETICV